MRLHAAIHRQHAIWHVMEMGAVTSKHAISCCILLSLRNCDGGVQGEYKSVMIIVTPCRSDLSAEGLSPLSHLADGRLTLALVKRCSIAQYLRFLALIPRTGGHLKKPQHFSGSS